MISGIAIGIIVGLTLGIIVTTCLAVGADKDRCDECRRKNLERIEE